MRGKAFDLGSSTRDGRIVCFINKHATHKSGMKETTVPSTGGAGIIICATLMCLCTFICMEANVWGNR